MLLNIISLEKVVYKDKIKSITLPGDLGELTILPGHLPLITSLKKGKIKIRTKNSDEIVFEIEKGVLEVKPGEVNVLI